MAQMPMPMSADTAEDPVALAKEFLEADLSSRPGGGSKELSVLTTGGSGFDRTNGSWTFVESPSVRIKVSTTQQRVVAMDNLAVSPREVAVEDANGRTRSPEEMRGMVVQVPVEVARDRGVEYANRHIGKETMGGLSISADGLVSRGSRFVYRFAWRTTLDEDGVAFGMETVSVEIDPTSGEVLRFRNLVSKVDEDQPIAIEATRCRRIVESDLGHLEGFKVTQMVLVSLLEEDSTSVPAWAVGYEFVGPMGRRPGACYVHAMTGKLLK